MVLFIFITVLNANIILDGKDEYSNFSNKIEFYKDKTNNLIIDEVLQKNFIKNKQNRLAFKYTSYTYWLKFNINNKSLKDYILDLSNPLVEKIDIYYFKDGKLVNSYKMGTSRKNYTKITSNRTFVFPLNITGEYTIYMKIKSSKTLSLPFLIRSEKSFYEYKYFDSIYNTIFYACLLLMFVYNFFIYIISKVDIYKYYLGYILGVLGFLFYFDGYSLCFLFSDYPTINNLFVYIFYFLLFFSVSKFSSELLLSKKNSTFLHNILIRTSTYILSFLSLLAVLFYLFFIDYLYLVHKFLFVTTILIICVIITIALKQYIMNKQIISKAYALAWIVFMIIALMFILNIILALVNIDIMTKVIKISILVEVILMSLLIAYKLKKSNEDNMQLELKNKEQELYILRQTRLASFGEILNSIVHEWKQPLHRINMISLELEITFNKNELTREYLDKQLNEIEFQTKYMNDTVNRFLDYFNPRKQKEDFNLVEAIKEAIKLLSIKLKKNNVNYLIDCSDLQICTNGFKKEYIQVIIILLNNSIDAIVKEEIENPNIIFEVIEKDGEPILSVIDNANGIKIEPIEKVFEANVSTKDEKVSSGIGLFIAKRIIEDNMNKKLTCENHHNGAKFSIIG